MLLRKLLLLLCISLLTACGEQVSYHAQDVTVPLEKADFHLTDINGKPRSLADFRGKVVVLFFGYTHCPLVCPTTLADLAQIMRMLGKDAERVQVLFITVDPERDTQELLAKFAGALQAPLVKTARLLNALPNKFAYGLTALIEKQEAEA